MDQFRITSSPRMMPQVGWALGNIIFFATGSDHNFVGQGKFTQDLDYASYIHVVVILAENLLAWLDKVGWIRKVYQESQGNSEASDESFDAMLIEACATNMSLKMSYLDYFKPACQQWHLMKLLTLERDSSIHVVHYSPRESPEFHGKWELLNVAYYYFFMLRIFTILNPVGGSLPVLNMLSFTPGFLFSMWEALEKSLFPGKSPEAVGIGGSKSSGKSGKMLERKQKSVAKDGGNKWFHLLRKITSKSQADFYHISSNNDQPNSDQTDEVSIDTWDIETLKRGPEGLSKGSFCLLHLFCATYSHLLLVLDDIEFYEKQVQ